MADGTLTKKKRAPRLTIFQKVQVADYVRQLEEEHQRKFVVTKKKRKGKKPRSNKRKKSGVNVQRLCELKFPFLHGIKVCQLVFQCDKQQWRALSVQQQKRYYHLPDSLKVALGLGSRVRGWKSLSKDDLVKTMTDGSKINRWNVPSSVLQELGLFHKS